MKVVRSVLIFSVAMMAMMAMMPIAAEARSFTQIDRSGDVDQSPRPVTPGVPFTPAPDRADGDITSTFMAHRKHVVRVRFAFRDLARSGPHLYRIRIKSNHLSRVVYLSARPGHWRGAVKTRTWGGKRVHCDVRHTIDYLANTVSIRVPRSCLGNPRWIEVADEDVTRTDTRIYIDQGGAGSTEELVYGPRLTR